MILSRKAAPAGGGSTVYVALASIVAAASGLLFGFDIAVINGAILFLQQQFRLSGMETELAAGSLLARRVFGAGFGGALSDRFGRRRTLTLAAVLFTVSSLGAALPRNLAEFMAARFAGGLASGVASLLAPVYIAEVAPAHLRGRLVSLNQMAIVTGILLAYLINWGLASRGPESWRSMFAASAIPSNGFLAALFSVPESPRWLTEMGRTGEALEVLVRVNGGAAAERELRGIRSAIAEETGTLGELLRPPFRRPLFLAIALAVLQQITGINTVLFYGSVVFKEQVGGQTDAAAIGANVIVGVVNSLATVVALWVIDRAGRRPLLMISAAGMALCQAALGAAFLLSPPPAVLVLAIMLLCVVSFAVGLGPLYGALCVVMFAIVWRMVPETKGRTLGLTVIRP